MGLCHSDRKIMSAVSLLVTDTDEIHKRYDWKRLETLKERHQRFCLCWDWAEYYNAMEKWSKETKRRV